MKDFVVIGLYGIWFSSSLRTGAKLHDGEFGEAILTFAAGLTAFGALCLINGWVQ